MNEVLQFIGLALTAALLAVILRRSQPQLAMAVSLAGGVLLLLMALDRAAPLLRQVLGLAEQQEGLEEIMGIACKITGIAVATDAGAQVCRDAGEGALAGRLELGGKVLMLTLALPLALQFLQILGGDILP